MEHFIDSLYSQFLLRDLLAKVVPGLILLLALFGFFANLLSGIVFSLSVLNILITLLLIYGICFVLSMTIQYFGGRVGFITIYVWPSNEDKSSLEVSLAKHQELLMVKDLPKTVLRQRERFTILKEMTGNFALSFSIISISMFFLSLGYRGSTALSLLCLIPITSVLAFALFRQNKHHAEEQYLWEKGILENKEWNK